MSGEGSSCPRCGAPLAAGQEYCLECGLRQTGRSRLGPLPTETRALRLRIAGLAAVAVAGAAVAIAVVADDTGAQEVLTATGGSVTVPTRVAGAKSRLAVWPRDRSGWTIVLVSTPKGRGEGQAVAVAQQARSRGLAGVGVLDSSQFASLQPGYWMTFAGRFQSEADATGSLRRARAAVKGARVQKIEP
ncbi:MAG TPA: zinc ribbon domain-containing protein [Gaiellaceae bacterium]|nr:zinc ribbon domain-containing protein [Gaiellaceae bacterium]